MLCWDGMGWDVVCCDVLCCAVLCCAVLIHRLISAGEKHYNADGRAPLRYFKVLMLSQQFEQAIAYVVRKDYFLMGVHYAIALDYYGLLNRAQPSQDLCML